MTQFEFLNITPNIVDGRILSIQFVLKAVDADLEEEIEWHTPCSLPERSTPYVDADYKALAESIATQNSLRAKLVTKLQEKRAIVQPPPPTPVVAPTDAEKRASMVKHVDDLIRGIIGKAMGFQMGYLEREAEAKRYKASGYEGIPNTWITRFADNVSLPYNTATELILSQAVKLRKDNKDLEDLRMDKYLIANAPTMALAEAHYNRIIRGAADIERTI